MWNLNHREWEWHSRWKTTHLKITRKYRFWEGELKLSMSMCLPEDSQRGHCGCTLSGLLTSLPYWIAPTPQWSPSPRHSWLGFMDSHIYLRSPQEASAQISSCLWEAFLLLTPVTRVISPSSKPHTRPQCQQIIIIRYQRSNQYHKGCLSQPGWIRGLKRPH